MLNKTSAKQVKNILPEFFFRWPEPAIFLIADHDEVKDLIAPLGFKNVRTQRLMSMTRAFLFDDWEDVSELPGVGKYARDSFEMFVVGYIVDDVCDKELKNYVMWAKSLN